MVGLTMAEIFLPPYLTGPARLITPQSYMIDRFVPDCEIIALPAKEVAGGVLRYNKTQLTFPAISPKGRLAQARARLRQLPPQRIKGRVLIDLRHHDPGNWAHFLNNHLPIVFQLCAATGIAWSEVLLVTPSATPAYIRAAAELFGLDLLETDGAVEGEGLAFEMTPWTAIRTVRAQWASAPGVADALTRAIQTDAPPLPRRPFLARRDTRTIANMGEVEACLSDRGYETVYAEDYSAADQFRLFREAESMVAVHGAGLAPLLCVPPNGHLRQLIEILPIGHMTDVYRVMAEQVGVSWIGVRGRIKPTYVEAAYRLTDRFDAFSLDSFEVDVVALTRALDFIEEKKTDDSEASPTSCRSSAFKI